MADGAKRTAQEWEKFRVDYCQILDKLEGDVHRWRTRLDQAKQRLEEYKGLEGDPRYLQDDLDAMRTQAQVSIDAEERERGVLQGRLEGLPKGDLGDRAFGDAEDERMVKLASNLDVSGG